MENKQREIKEQVEKGIKKKVDDRLKTKKLWYFIFNCNSTI